MPADYLSNPAVFLVNALVGAYIFVLIFRVLLQLSGASSSNPISAFIIKVTRHPLNALKPIFPTIKNINLAAVVLIVGLQMLIGFIMLASLPGANSWAIFIWSVSEVIVQVINVFTYSIFISIILSWINPGLHNPVTELLYKITEPILAPCQRLIPPMGGLDLSPMAALLGLQVLKMLLIPPLHALM